MGGGGVHWKFHVGFNLGLHLNSSCFIIVTYQSVLLQLKTEIWVIFCTFLPQVKLPGGEPLTNECSFVWPITRVVAVFPTPIGFSVSIKYIRITKVHLSEWIGNIRQYRAGSPPVQDCRINQFLIFSEHPAMRMLPTDRPGFNNQRSSKACSQVITDEYPLKWILRRHECLWGHPSSRDPHLICKASYPLKLDKTRSTVLQL